MVRVCKSGKHCPALKIDHARIFAYMTSRCRVTADKEDAVAFDRDCLGMGLAVIGGIDGAVDEDEIGNPCRRTLLWSQPTAEVEQQHTQHGQDNFHGFFLLWNLGVQANDVRVYITGDVATARR
jgi:hypothetical protein